MPVEITPMWAEFYTKFYRRTGLDLKLYRQEQMQRRILGLVDARGLGNLQELGKLVERDAAEAENIVDRLAINVSELFRNPEKWIEMERKVLPQLREGSSRLKCWSAGCSYGAEAFTLASILARNFPGEHQILGTDIDETALTQARKGEFSVNDVRGVPKEILKEYFEESGGVWRAKASLKRPLSFKKGNLLEDRFQTGFDLIMCRNVVIYFTDEAKDALYRKFFQALRPGGILFIGSTERIPSARELGFNSPLPFFYQKPTEGQTLWRNAS